MTVLAHTLTCTVCGEVARWLGSSTIRADPPPGWDRGKRVMCPACSNKQKGKKMAVASVSPTPMAAVAWRKMNSLLEDNFDPDLGVYKEGFSDASIAKDTGMSVQAVKDYRMAAFGKLRPPSAVDEAVRDLRELETLFLRMESEVKEKLKDLQARVRDLQKRFD